MSPDDSSVEIEAIPDSAFGYADGAGIAGLAGIAANDAHAQADAYDPEQGLRPRHHSFVRICLDDELDDDVYSEPATLRPVDAAHRDALSNDQLDLTVNLLHLARLLQGEPMGLLTEPALTTMRDRMGDLEDVREAIEALLDVKSARLDRLFAPGASFSAYLKGLYLYCEGVVETYEEALNGDAALEGDALRFRLAEASQFYFDGLAHPIRADLARENGATDALAIAEELFFAATFLHEQILSDLRGLPSALYPLDGFDWRE